MKETGDQTWDRSRVKWEEDGKIKGQVEKTATQHIQDQPFQTRAEGQMGKTGSRHFTKLLRVLENLARSTKKIMHMKTTTTKTNKHI